MHGQCLLKQSASLPSANTSHNVLYEHTHTHARTHIHTHTHTDTDTNTQTHTHTHTKLENHLSSANICHNEVHFLSSVNTKLFSIPVKVHTANFALKFFISTSALLLAYFYKIRNSKKHLPLASVFIPKKAGNIL